MVVNVTLTLSSAASEAMSKKADMAEPQNASKSCPIDATCLEDGQSKEGVKGGCCLQQGNGNHRDKGLQDGYWAGSNEDVNKSCWNTGFLPSDDNETPQTQRTSRKQNKYLHMRRQQHVSNCAKKLARSQQLTPGEQEEMDTVASNFGETQQNDSVPFTSSEGRRTSFWDDDEPLRAGEQDRSEQRSCTQGGATRAERAGEPCVSCGKPHDPFSSLCQPWLEALEKARHRRVSGTDKPRGHSSHASPVEDFEWPRFDDAQLASVVSPPNTACLGGKGGTNFVWQKTSGKTTAQKMLARTATRISDSVCAAGTLIWCVVQSLVFLCCAQARKLRRLCKMHT